MGKKLGQHFLRSQAVLADILAAAEPVRGEPVLEIGPGEGALTGQLLAAGVRLTAVELDTALSAGLRRRWGENPDFRLIEGDVLTADLSPVALFGSGEPYAIVANLPYYLSTPFFFRLIPNRLNCRRMVLMVQLEIAERLVAQPGGGKAYGSLSIAAGHAFEMRLLFTVQPGAFSPPPKVHSAVVSFIPRRPLLAPEEERKFLHHVKQMFMGRRKKMINTIKRSYPALADPKRSNLEQWLGGRRAEALTPAEHLELYKMIASPLGE